ncbi:putative secreted protein [Mycolicibacterium flavescens]|uniref:hypothetical protein n=1 Tax=Mycobacterium neumannii TaxID=2048551 RepID=UPI000B93AA87|nr:hypothetical protein [Mycobacterium neumannii]VEG43697.1 putative secreted protein [Mycolicibacterium flavescens]
MDNARVAAAAITAAAMGLCGIAASTVASAETYGIELEGDFAVTSDGDRAKTNSVYFDQATVNSIWTISSTCSSPTACTGEVTSDRGWTAPLEYTVDRWIVRRTIENWVPCPDGTAAPGAQMFMFYPVDASGLRKPESNILTGSDTTKGPSGACGTNARVVITMPLHMRKLA